MGANWGKKRTNKSAKRVPQGKSEPNLPTYLRDHARHFFFVPRLRSPDLFEINMGLGTWAAWRLRRPGGTRERPPRPAAATAAPRAARHLTPFPPASPAWRRTGRGPTAGNPREAEYECRRRANAGEALDPPRVHVRRRRMTIEGASAAAGHDKKRKFAGLRDDGRDRIRYGHDKKTKHE